MCVGVGGFIGSVLRYGISLAFQAKSLTQFPWSTLTVNLIGSFLIGLLLAIGKKSFSDNTLLLLVTGLLGGFTTFSAFSVEVVALFKNDRADLGIYYVLLTVAGGLLLTALSYNLVIRNNQ